MQYFFTFRNRLSCPFCCLLYLLDFLVRPFVVRDFICEVANRVFYCFEVSFVPVKRGNQAGSSRNEFNYPRRGTQTSFPFLHCCSCQNFGLAHFYLSSLKKRFIKQSPLFDQLSVFSRHKWKMSWSEILETATLETRKTALGTLLEWSLWWCPSFMVVRGRRRGIAAGLGSSSFSLARDILFALIHGRLWGAWSRPLQGNQHEWRETRDEWQRVGHDSRY